MKTLITIFFALLTTFLATGQPTDAQRAASNALIRSHTDGQNTKSFIAGVFDQYNQGKVSRTEALTTAGVNTYTVSADASITGFTKSFQLFLRFPNANSGTATLNVNGLGAKNLKTNAGAALTGGEIVAASYRWVVYDVVAGYFKLDGDGGSGGGGTWGTITGMLSSQTDLQAALDLKITNPMTSTADMIYGGASGAPTRLVKDVTATRYISNTGTLNAPAWAQINLANGVTGTLPVANGGTGQSSVTAYAPLFGGTTSTGAIQSGTVGTSGQVLTSNGAGSIATFQDASGGGWANTGAFSITDPTATGNWTLAGNQTISGAGKYLGFSVAGGGMVTQYKSTQFSTYGGYNTNISEVDFGDPQKDLVWQSGYNVGIGGVRLNLNDGALYDQKESHFNGISTDDFEDLTNVISRDGTLSKRLHYNIINKTTLFNNEFWDANTVDWRVNDLAPSYANITSSGTLGLTGLSGGLTVTNTTDNSGFTTSSQSGGNTFTNTATLTPGAPHWVFQGAIGDYLLTRFNNSNNTSAAGSILALQYNGAERAYIQGLAGNHGTFPNGLLIRNLTVGGAVGIYNGQYALLADGSGRIGINGVTSPLANLHLPAGSATAGFAPLTFTTGGTESTTPANGILEPATGDANLKYHAGGVKYILAKTLTNTATLDFGSTAAGAATDLTITVTGASDGDPVSLGVPNGSTLSDGAFSAWVSSSNTVTVRFANNNLISALDPASGTFRASVVHY